MKALITLLAVGTMFGCTMIVNSENVKIDQATQVPEVVVNQKDTVTE